MQRARFKLTARLMYGDEIAIGPGKADLLDTIDRERSISGAARAMGMSYRRAWLLVDTMNRCWADRLVETVPGGGQGAGASLTDTGRRVLELYRALASEADALASGGSADGLKRLLRSESV